MASDSRPILRATEFIEKTCKALGIDPTYVSCITITAKPNEFVVVDVVRIGTRELLNIDLSGANVRETDGGT